MNGIYRGPPRRLPFPIVADETVRRVGQMVGLEDADRRASTEADFSEQRRIRFFAGGDE